MGYNGISEGPHFRTGAALSHPLDLILHLQGSSVHTSAFNYISCVLESWGFPLHPGRSVNIDSIFLTRLITFVTQYLLV